MMYKQMRCHNGARLTITRKMQQALELPEQIVPQRNAEEKASPWDGARFRVICEMPRSKSLNNNN